MAKQHTVAEDFVVLYSIFMKHHDKRAPVKRPRVKCTPPQNGTPVILVKHEFKEINVSVKNGDHSINVAK